MKLILVLSLVAVGYAAKLDRTYLPPSNAATAGGSPGALTAPGATTGFGQGLPNIPSGLSDLSTPSFGQNSGSKIPSTAGYVQGPGRGQISGNFPGTGSLGFDSNTGPSANEIQDVDAPSRPNFGQASNNFGLNTQSKTPFGQSGQSNGQAFAQPEDRPERPQAAADRNAEILKYINENNGDSYEYSYETSNGISAEESGVATNGVRAQGGFSYTGDDGNSYSITYTADENGFQPQGEHLPTPPPIPEEILKSIEENARAAAAGTQEGAYRPDEYESDSSPTPYSSGAANYPSQRPATSLQGQGSSPVNQGQSPQGPSAQGSFNGNTFSAKTEQGPKQDSNNLFGTPQGQNIQGQNGNGYNYNRPLTPGASGQQQGQSTKPLGPGSLNNGLPGQQSGQTTGQLNQPSRPLQDLFNEYAPGQSQNQRGSANQYTPGQNIQGQNGNGYNYNRPLTPGASGQQQGQSTKPQGPGGLNNGLPGQQSSQTTGQLNQPSRPVQGSFNQYTPGQNQNQRGSSNQYTPGQNQNGNGYNYDRPQVQDSNQFAQRNQGQPQNSVPSSTTGKGLSDQSSGPSNQFNQQQRPVQNTNNQFGNQQVPNQYSQRQNGQGNGYNYNQPQKQGSRFPGSGSQQSTNDEIFRQKPSEPSREFNQAKRPLQGSSNIFGKPQQPSNQFSKGQSGQEQRGDGYNYDQPQNRPQGSNQLSGFGNQAGQPAQPGQGGAGANDIASPFRSQTGQSFNQFGQSPLQGVSSSGSRKQQGESGQFSPKQNFQDQDENGYYYNRPQNAGSSQTGPGSFSLIRPQSNTQGQSGSAFRPSSNTMQPSFGRARPESANGFANGQPGSQAGGSQYSPEKMQSFGSQSNAAGSRPNERYQPSLLPASPFSQQQTSSQNRPTSGPFGSPRPSQGSSSQTLAQGYQYGSPDQSSNQSQRPGFNGNQSNVAPGVNKGSPAASEFGGPRQPPSFSPEEGYKY